MTRYGCVFLAAKRGVLGERGPKAAPKAKTPPKPLTLLPSAHRKRDLTTRHLFAAFWALVTLVIGAIHFEKARLSLTDAIAPAAQPGMRANTLA
jgi:hypothetical protein